MPNNIGKDLVWIIGAGNMACAYAKVLKALDLPFIAIGRSEERTKQFRDQTGAEAYSGGIEDFLKKNPELPLFAIVAVQTPLISECACLLLNYGVKKILVEKPGALKVSQLDQTAALAKEKDAIVRVGYNRRFFASTLAAEKIIEKDGGVRSFCFEFTELYRVISTLQGDVSRWFYGNSSHVLDLAFYLGGTPKEMACYKKDQVEGYTSTVMFSGAGISEKDALFSYQANYLAPGRWGVEVLTRKHRLIFRPLEQLQVQELGSFSAEPYTIDASLDAEFKGGLYLQVKTFLETPDDLRLLSIEEQAQHMRWYEKIHNGTANE